MATTMIERLRGGRRAGGAPARAGTGAARDRWAALALPLAAFVSSLGAFVTSPFLPAMAADLGIGVALLGQVPALAALASAGLGLAVGPLADRLGHRRCLLLALAALAAGALGTGLAPGYAALLLAALAGAVGRAATTPTAQAIAGDRFAGDARRRIMSAMTAGVSVALVAGVPLLTAVAAPLGWRAAFIALALLTVASAILARRVLAPDGPTAAAWPRPRDLLGAYAPIARHRPSLALVGASALGLAGAGTLLTYLGAVLAERHGFTTQHIGAAYVALGAGALVGSAAVGGRLGDRPLRPLLAGSRVAIGLLAGAALLLPLPALAAVGLLVLAVALMAVANVATPTLLAAEAPGGRATAMALNGAAMGLGTALGGGLGGLLLATGGFATLGLATLGWYVTSAVLVWWSRSGRPATSRIGETAPAGQSSRVQ